MSSKQFNYDLARFDKTEVQIGGIPVKVYNLKQLEAYLQKITPTTSDQGVTEIPINILYLLHGRESKYQATEECGYHMVDRFYAKKNGTVEVPLVFITFDLPNHGERNINKVLNLAWDEGNSKHAADMIALIDNSVVELKFIMEQLPFHLNFDHYIPLDLDYKLQFKNILSGYSLGAHITFRFAIKYPENVDIINPTIGCTELSSLLIERLLSVKPTGIKRFLQEYEELDLNDSQALAYPKSLHKYVSSVDDAIFNDFPFEKVNMFASFGETDQLVPLSYSKLFCELYNVQNPNTGIFVQPQVGHKVTVEMLDNFVDWLTNLI